MNSIKRLRESVFKLKKSLLISPQIGAITDTLGLHNGVIGRPRALIKLSDLTTLSNSKMVKRLINSALPITRPYPKTMDSNVHKAFEASINIKRTDFYCYHLTDAYVTTNLGWVLTKDRYFLIESSPEPEMFNYEKIQNLVLWPKVERVHKKIVMAYNRWTPNNYYHWLLEYLPKISVFIDPPNAEFSDLFSEAKIILPPSPTQWMLKFLDMLGVNEDRIVQPTGRQLRVDQLIFIPGFEQPYNVPLWAIKWLRDRFSSYIYTSDPKKKRIYVSRRKAIHRRVRNEDEMIAFLSKYGFDEYILEDMSLEEQIALFSQAEIVVGPHGAGFSNLIFSTNATLIDLFEPTHVHPCFFNLCHDTGQDYWYVMGEKADRNHMLVDIEKLQKTLELALKQRSLT